MCAARQVSSSSRHITGLGQNYAIHFDIIQDGFLSRNLFAPSLTFSVPMALLLVYLW